MKKSVVNKKNQEGLKLSKYLQKNVPKYFPRRGELVELIETIAEATIPIRGLLERGITSREINYRMHITESQEIAENIYEEEQIHEDVLTHSIIMKAIQEADVEYAYIASEEAEPVLGNGKFGITIDPVDGSSNVAVNRTVGTIVGIYDEQEGIICAFYVLYGIFTNLILSINGKVAEFILDTTPYSMTFYHFIFLEEIEMPNPKEGGIRCLGGDPKDWPEKCQKYKQNLIRKNFKDRYSGSFVGDFHAVIKYGGIYAYFPSPKPKLRLYYEWLPLAFICKSLGGEFLIIGVEQDLDKVEKIENVSTLTKENVEKIHSSICGGLIGSKYAVLLYNQIE
ncbi:MAG: putative Fructose-bisphosphatase [Promethearchaeota archaeon]|nr:MAG: putative Fructose-bisphosphatase [Candidatus Lokiarchaeota archaeon]